MSDNCISSIRFISCFNNTGWFCAHFCSFAIFAWLILIIFSPDQGICCFNESRKICSRKIIILRKYYKQGDLIGICHIWGPGSCEVPG